MKTTSLDKSDRRMSIGKVAFASAVGCTIEWYDFFLYGTVAGLVFNKLFFPSYDPLVGTMLAYVTFAVGFLSRPLGGIIFGHFGDKIGRKSVLVLTLIVMGIATFLIGCLPTYNSAGIWAPILLLTLRICQGLGIGGEWGGAVLMAVEHSSDKKVGFYGSWPQLGVPAGLFMGTGIVALLSHNLSEEQFLSWGWRLAFLISAALVAVGLYIRFQILETPAFDRIRESGTQARVPIMEVLREYPRNVLLGMGARFIEGASFNIYAVFIIAYLTTVMKLPRTTALNTVSVASVVMIFFLLIWGNVADRYGRQRVFAFGSIITGIMIFPTFWVIDSWPQNTLVVFVTVAISFGVLWPAIWASEATLFSEIFDARVRYSGMSFVYQMSGIFASGLTPIVATYLLTADNNKPWLIAAYIAVISIISAICASLLKIHQIGEKTISQPKIGLQDVPGHAAVEHVSLTEG
jgi:MFS family permease